MAFSDFNSGHRRYFGSFGDHTATGNEFRIPRTPDDKYRLIFTACASLTRSAVKFYLVQGKGNPLGMKAGRSHDQYY
jgi:hypothetical protein